MWSALNGSKGGMPAAGEIIGHPVAVAVLARALQSGRISHAYLFHGPRGIGKRTAARLFASAIQCLAARERLGTEDHPGLRSCGSCDSCRRIAAGTHPDVIEVEPDTSTGQNISVRQAAAVVANVALRPKAGPRRLFLIGRAELLHEDAANTLLKTLEEPSSFATLVLCVPNQELVLPTIRSRCQPVRFDPVPAPLLAASLARRYDIDPEEAMRVALSAGGRPGAALAGLADPSLPARRERILAIFDHALDVRARCEADPSALVHALQLSDRLRREAQEHRQSGTPERGVGVARDGADGARPLKSYLMETLDLGRTYLRDILVLGTGASETAAEHQDRMAEIRRHAAATPPEATAILIDLLGETTQILDRNVAPQLAVERMFMNLLHPRETP
jgi:DNA polymerase-3 subunit delta'